MQQVTLYYCHFFSFEPSDIDCPMSVDYREQEDFPLSMNECKRLIKELRAVNQQQSHEVIA